MEGSSTSGGRRETKPRGKRWPHWLMFSVFAFLAFECLLLAVVMKGPWFILVIPAIVCGIKAKETWGKAMR